MWKITFITFGFLLFFTEVVKAVKIKDIKVPSVYMLKNMENPDPILFECDYEIEQGETGFVLKWLLNNITIYQWISNKGKPNSLSFMKNRINLDYDSPSSDPTKKYRFMQITNPTYNMSGYYQCSASTYETNDKRESYLQIIVPESDFQLHHTVDSNSMLNINCSATGVSPKPTLSITLSDEQIIEVADRDILRDDGLYDVHISTKIEKGQLESPTAITCVLSIPNTNYTVKQTAVYYDGLLKKEMVTDEITTPRIYSNGNGANTSELSRLEATSPTMRGDNSSSMVTVSITLLVSTLLLAVSYWTTEIIV